MCSVIQDGVDELSKDGFDAVERIVILCGAPFCVREGVMEAALESGEERLDSGNGRARNARDNLVVELWVSVDERVE